MIWEDLDLLTRSQLARVITASYQEMTSIEKAALAFLKIKQLIEICYGGNVTNEEWENSDICKYYIFYNSISKQFEVDPDYTIKEQIAFHTKEQAKEFLSHPENILLLKDYYEA